MTADFQTIAALSIVALAATLLLLGFIRKRKSPGCGGDCGCPSSALKAKLKP